MVQGDVPFKGLVPAILEFIRKLFELKEDSTVISACHILKVRFTKNNNFVMHLQDLV